MVNIMSRKRKNKIRKKNSLSTYYPKWFLSLRSFLNDRMAVWCYYDGEANSVTIFCSIYGRELGTWDQKEWIEPEGYPLAISSLSELSERLIKIGVNTIL